MHDEHFVLIPGPFFFLQGKKLKMSTSDAALEIEHGAEAVLGRCSPRLCCSPAPADGLPCPKTPRVPITPRCPATGPPTFFFFFRMTFTPSTDTTRLTFFFLMFLALNSYCRERPGLALGMLSGATSPAEGRFPGPTGLLWGFMAVRELQEEKCYISGGVRGSARKLRIPEGSESRAGGAGIMRLPTSVRSHWMGNKTQELPKISG